MKKKIAVLLLMTLTLVNVIPVMAEEPGKTNLTDIMPAGSTAVEADILDEDIGAVSYIISIPEKIDFGTLQMPSDTSEPHVKTVGFQVSAVEIDGLDTTTSRIAVLMKNAVATTDTFQIQGNSETNNDKILRYTVLNAAGNDITTGVKYTNGYAFAAFSAIGQSVNGTLSLEQNQLCEDTNLANWVGDYLGTINFYTAIASIADYN